MRETRLSGSEGGKAGPNRPSLPYLAYRGGNAPGNHQSSSPARQAGRGRRWNAHQRPTGQTEQYDCAALREVITITTVPSWRESGAENGNKSNYLPFRGWPRGRDVNSSPSFSAVSVRRHSLPPAPCPSPPPNKNMAELCYVTKDMRTCVNCYFSNGWIEIRKRNLSFSHSEAFG